MTERVLRERAMQAGRTADDYAHQHPWQLAGVAAAVGVLAGVLLARR